MRAAISAALVAWPLASVGLAAQDPVPPPAADTILPPATDTLPPPVTDTLAPPATDTLAPPVAESPPPNPGVAVDSVEVRGNQRIAANTIRGTAGLAADATITAVDVQRAIRRLMSSGDFANVRVYSRDPTGAGTTLVVEVVERPLIASTIFPGLESVGAGTVRDTVGWEPRQPLDPQRVVRTEQMIRDLLAKRGVQLVSLDTALTLVPGDSQAYRLAFNVREGNRLAIANIDFEGNSAFDDGELRGAISTSQEGFFWFRSGRFDRSVFEEDLQTRLPAFYASHGYLDFAVTSDTLVVDPETGKARLVVAVEEGPQYRLGTFEIEGNSRFPTEQLRGMYTLERRTVLGLPFGGVDERESGEVFDRMALDDATNRVKQMYNNSGYLYAQVEPVIRRVPATDGGQPTVDVTWAISERSPFYIRRVTIEGNTYTHDSVIRDRLYLLPGSVYSEDLVLQSYQSISGLGFFETPLPPPDIRPQPDSGVVDIVFQVKEKQTGNINFGTSIGGGYAGVGGGVSGFLGYSQPNLFGQGKQASLRVEYGFGRTRFEASYQDPALRGSRNSGSVSLFHTGDRFSVFGNGSRTRTGGSLQFGVPIPGLLRTRAFLGYALARTTYTPDDEDECDTDFTNVFCLPDATGSTLSLSVTRDTKNHPIFPTAGTRQTVAAEQTGGLLGGDGDFQKITTDAEWWVPIGSLGGGTPGARPVRFAIGMQARAGGVFGDASRFAFEKFVLGGVQTSQPLRGYEEASITPFGVVEGCRNNFRDECLGDAFLTLTGQIAARLNDNLSVQLFGDAGNSWRSVGEINPNRLLRGAGIGATVVTPFGPIGLDAAYGFDRPEPGWQLHFKLGQTF